MEKQKTIKKAISIEGIGLHTGEKSHLTFKPAAANTGINFLRTDLANSPLIRACPENVIEASRIHRRTSVGKDGVVVQTVEHLMAVLCGLGIDNLVVEVQGIEIPGLDGSGAGFFKILNDAGIQELDVPKKFFAVKEPIWVEDHDSTVAVLPSSQFRISYTLSYDHPLLRAEYIDIVIDPETFAQQIVTSRTFCLEEEADELRKEGLGKGANYQNTLVVGKTEVVKNKLRFDDEFARHKVLDLIGDMYLLGVPLKAHIIAVKSGHPLNIKLIKRLQHQRERYELAGVGSVGYAPVQGEVLDAETIKKILPHREPFLFVDRVLSIEEGKRAVGIKNLTINDYFFKGHFPGRPVMPGVLIVEAMAQVGGVLMLSPKENRGKLAFFLAVDNVKFRKTVVPGDQLVLEVNVGRIKSKTGQLHGVAYVDGKEVASADLMFALVEE